MGFIILGVALEQLARQSLDAFCQSEIFSPLELQTATFNPAKDKRYEIPPTADERIAIPEHPSILPAWPHLLTTSREAFSEIE